MRFGEKTGRSAFLAAKGMEVVRLKEIPSTYENSVCIGDLVPISAEEGNICDVDLYVSPTGAITVCVPMDLSDGDISSGSLFTISQIVSAMSQWSHENLDEIATDHFYRLDGQAALVIDVMVRNGLLSYSGKHTLCNSLDEALAAGNILFISADPPYMSSISPCSTSPSI